MRIFFLTASRSGAICRALLILFLYADEQDTGVPSASPANSADLAWDRPDIFKKLSTAPTLAP